MRYILVFMMLLFPVISFGYEYVDGDDTVSVYIKPESFGNYEEGRYIHAKMVYKNGVMGKSIQKQFKLKNVPTHSEFVYATICKERRSVYGNPKLYKDKVLIKQIDSFVTEVEEDTIDESLFNKLCSM